MLISINGRKRKKTKWTARLRQKNMFGQKQVCNFYMQIKFISGSHFSLGVLKIFSLCFVFLDYYNYYYGGYSENQEATDTHEGQNVEMATTAAAAASTAADAASTNEATEVTASNAEAVTEVAAPAENTVATAEVGV